MQIRKASISDLEEILSLFEDTIRNVNSTDYSEEQVEVWTSAKNLEIWSQKIKEHFFYVATANDEIIGFGSLEVSGYLDFMYVHHNHQRKGIAFALLNKLEGIAKEKEIDRIWSSVSLTAQPFFKKHGYRHFEDEHKMVSGIHFKNALMEKRLN